MIKILKIGSLLILILFISPLICFADDLDYVTFTDAGNQQFSISEANKDTIDITSDFTFEWTMRINTYPSATVEYVFYNFLTGTGYFISFNNSGMMVRWNDASGDCRLESPAPFTDGGWHHYAVSVDVDSAGNGQWFFDGVATTSTATYSACTGLADSSRDPATINQTSNLDVDIGYQRLWTSQRVQNEIYSYMGCDFDVATGTLTMLLDFNNNGNDDINNNDWTQLNSPGYASTTPHNFYCALESGTSTSTSTSVSLPCNFKYINDLAFITGCVEHYTGTGSTTTLTETEYHYYRIPFFIYLVLVIPFIYLLGRVIIEILIILRKK